MQAELTKSKQYRSKSYDLKHIENNIFKYSQERFTNAMYFFREHEREIMRDLLSYFISESRRDLSSKIVFFVPILPDISKGEMYSLLASSSGYKDMFLMEVLNNKEDLLLTRFGITSPFVYMLASGKEIPVGLSSEDIRKSKVVGKLFIPQGGVGGEIGRINKKETRSSVMLTWDGVRVILDYVFLELNKRGRIRNRKTVMVKLEDVDVRLFGKYISDLASEYGNVKIAISTPSREGADQYYELLASRRVLSLFDQGKVKDVAEKIYKKITDPGFLSKMPQGLRELVKLMDSKNYLKGSIKYITKSVEGNPILAVKATFYYIANAYGYMNRRADKFNREMDALSKNGMKDVVNHIMTTFKHMLYRNVEIAVYQVIGNISSRKVVPSSGYVLSLNDFISGLSDDKLERLYSTLRKEELYPDAIDVLINIGAIREVGGYISRTRIGRVLEKLMEKELIRRGKRIENRREQQEHNLSNIKIRLISEGDVESRLREGT